MKLNNILTTTSLLLCTGYVIWAAYSLHEGGPVELFGGVFFACATAFLILDRDVWFKRYHTLKDSAMSKCVGVRQTDYTTREVVVQDEETS